jgi:hypothetical protein
LQNPISLSDLGNLQNRVLIIRYWYLFSLGVVIAAMPFSKFFISFGQFMLAGGWIVEQFDATGFIEKMKPRSISERIMFAIPDALFLLFRGIARGFVSFFRHRPALIFFSILLIHLLGLILTTDFDYALKDLRTKLPLLLLPLMVATSVPISEKAFQRYMALFILAVLVRTLFNSWQIYLGNFVDIRDVSRNVSHIILSLQISLGIYISGYYAIRFFRNATIRAILMLFAAGWFIFYLFLTRSFTGIAISALVLMIMIPFFITGLSNRLIKWGLLASITTIAVVFILSGYSMVRDYYRIVPIDITKLDLVTSRGNQYIHNYFSKQTENGYRLWLYVQRDEMREAWDKRSSLCFDSLDLQGHRLDYTLTRFLTSKGWRKDADAVERLSNEEVKAIEKGVANHVFIEGFSIRGRIYEFLAGMDEYRKTGNPTGSTVMQRVEFWKASVLILQENWLTGVGTGDMNVVFQEQYQKMGSQLDSEHRRRSHNQYLSVWIGFGIFGLAWFLAAILLPPFLMHRQRDYFFLIFLMISLLSMLTEDTIESQTGVTFFALFYTLFMFARWRFPSENHLLQMK